MIGSHCCVCLESIPDLYHDDLPVFKFPVQKPLILEQWIEFAKLPSASLDFSKFVMCSKHFKGEDIEIQRFRTVPKPFAVPCLFPPEFVLKFPGTAWNPMEMEVVEDPHVTHIIPDVDFGDSLVTSSRELEPNVVPLTHNELIPIPSPPSESSALLQQEEMEDLECMTCEGPWPVSLIQVQVNPLEAKEEEVNMMDEGTEAEVKSWAVECVGEGGSAESMEEQVALISVPVGVKEEPPDLECGDQESDLSEQLENNRMDVGIVKQESDLFGQLENNQGDVETVKQESHLFGQLEENQGEVGIVKQVSDPCGQLEKNQGDVGIAEEVSDTFRQLEKNQGEESAVMEPEDDFQPCELQLFNLVLQGGAVYAQPSKRRRKQVLVARSETGREEDEKSENDIIVTGISANVKDFNLQEEKNIQEEKNSQEMENKKAFLLEFIKLYESLPALWKKSSHDYSDKGKRKSGYTQLLEKYQEQYPQATVGTIKQKLDCLRIAFKQHSTKVLESERPCVSSDGIDPPKSWLFESLSFLKDEGPASSVSTTHWEATSENSTSIPASASPPTSQSEGSEEEEDNEFDLITLSSESEEDLERRRSAREGDHLIPEEQGQEAASSQAESEGRIIPAPENTELEELRDRRSSLRRRPQDKERVESSNIDSRSKISVTSETDENCLRGRLLRSRGCVKQMLETSKSINIEQDTEALIVKQGKRSYERRRGRPKRERNEVRDSLLARSEDSQEESHSADGGTCSRNTSEDGNRIGHDKVPDSSSRMEMDSDVGPDQQNHDIRRSLRKTKDRRSGIHQTIGECRRHGDWEARLRKRLKENKGAPVEAEKERELMSSTPVKIRVDPNLERRAGPITRLCHQKMAKKDESTSVDTNKECGLILPTSAKIHVDPDRERCINPDERIFQQRMVEDNESTAAITVNKCGGAEFVHSDAPAIKQEPPDTQYNVNMNIDIVKCEPPEIKQEPSESTQQEDLTPELLIKEESAQVGNKSLERADPKVQEQRHAHFSETQLVGSRRRNITILRAKGVPKDKTKPISAHPLPGAAPAAAAATSTTSATAAAATTTATTTAATTAATTTTATTTAATTTAATTTTATTTTAAAATHLIQSDCAQGETNVLYPASCEMLSNPIAPWPVMVQNPNAHIAPCLMPMMIGHPSVALMVTPSPFALVTDQNFHVVGVTQNVFHPQHPINMPGQTDIQLPEMCVEAGIASSPVELGFCPTSVMEQGLLLLPAEEKTSDACESTVNSGSIPLEMLQNSSVLVHSGF